MTTEISEFLFLLIKSAGQIHLFIILHFHLHIIDSNENATIARKIERIQEGCIYSLVKYDTM